MRLRPTHDRALKRFLLIMHISVWKFDSNPAIDRRSYRKSRAYCLTEIEEGRARPIDSEDISRGIQLLPPDVVRINQTEHRGSPESRGLLTANESHLNAQYRGHVSSGPLERKLRLLSIEYESRLEQHEAEGGKGSPRVCAVIAARVKTLLSDPALIQV
jgi:hypothetical protein